METEFQQSKVKSIIDDTFTQIKSISSSKTIMGDPIISPLGTTIIPVSKATVGFVLGAGEYNCVEGKRKPITYPMAGGSGGGVNLTPVGFLVENEKGVKFIPASGSIDNLQKIIYIAEKGLTVLGGKK